MSTIRLFPRSFLILSTLGLCGWIGKRCKKETIRIWGRASPFKHGIEGQAKKVDGMHEPRTGDDIISLFLGRGGCSSSGSHSDVS